MRVARHKRVPKLAGTRNEDIMSRHVGRFRERNPDWTAFEEGCSRKHDDTSVIPAGNFMLSAVYFEPNQGNWRAHS
jgi:hypothetical protein